MSEKANMAVKLDGELRERLQALGKSRQRTPHWLMREAIRLYVEQEEEVEKGKAQAREALRRYDVGGEHVADDKVMAWLSSWGKKDERPAPSLRRAPPRPRKAKAHG